MTVFPQRPAARLALTAAPEAVRNNPLEWARRRRADRDSRRVSAAESRAVHRLGNLGHEWHVVEWPHSVPLTRDPAVAQAVSKDIPPHAGFLAIGPGGVYSVSVAEHGRSRVLIAGDVVQIGSKRPPYIVQARKDARRAAKALSTAIGHDLTVIPVLAFVGNGLISVHGLPKDCMVTTYRELDRMLTAAGSRISPATAEKLAAVARSPWIWVNQPYRTEGGHSWQQQDATPGDTGTAQA